MWVFVRELSNIETWLWRVWVFVTFIAPGLIFYGFIVLDSTLKVAPRIRHSSRGWCGTSWDEVQEDIYVVAISAFIANLIIGSVAYFYVKKRGWRRLAGVLMYANEYNAL